MLETSQRDIILYNKRENCFTPHYLLYECHHYIYFLYQKQKSFGAFFTPVHLNSLCFFLLLKKKKEYVTKICNNSKKYLPHTCTIFSLLSVPLDEKVWAMMEMMKDFTVSTAFFLCTTPKPNLMESYLFFSWLFQRKEKPIPFLNFKYGNIIIPLFLSRWRLFPALLQ